MQTAVFCHRKQSQTTDNIEEGRGERGAEKADQKHHKSCIYFLILSLLVSVMSAVTKGI